MDSYVFSWHGIQLSLASEVHSNANAQTKLPLQYRVGSFKLSICDFRKFILYTCNATHSYYIWKLPLFECRAQKRMHQDVWTYKMRVYILSPLLRVLTWHSHGFSVDEGLSLLFFFFQKPYISLTMSVIKLSKLGGSHNQCRGICCVLSNQT